MVYKELTDLPCVLSSFIETKLLSNKFLLINSILACACVGCRESTGGTVEWDNKLIVLNKARDALSPFMVKIDMTVLGNQSLV